MKAEKSLRPIGKWVMAATKLGGQKTTSQGIIYNEKVTNKMVWSTVVALGDALTEDIRVGDKIMWDLTKNAGRNYGGKDLIHQDWIGLVERNK